MGKLSSKEILDDLRKQIRETGSGLVKLENRERAEKLYKWLDGKLPKDFGVFMPEIILGQFLAKIGGGAIWSFVISYFSRK